jgi:hypothetical protein
MFIGGSFLARSAAWAIYAARECSLLQGFEDLSSGLKNHFFRGADPITSCFPETIISFNASSHSVSVEA